MNFAQINAALPEELADRIARVAHKNTYDLVTKDIRNYRPIGIFDQAIRSGSKNIHDFIKTKYNDKVKIIIDDWVDWYTIVFIFPDTSQFAFYHHFLDNTESERYIVDGTFQGMDIRINRFVYQDDDGNIITEHPGFTNYIPFKKIIQGRSNIDISHIGEEQWIDPLAILKAFHKFEYKTAIY